MKKSPLIIWEKWKDPILNNLIDAEELSNNSHSLEEEDIYNNTEDFIENSRPTINKYPVIITPMGILPYTEKTSCDKTFNFWVGHTNFTITKNIANLIENADGIETLDIFTRYRFRIGIGKAFKDSKIMRNINSIIYEHINE